MTTIESTAVSTLSLAILSLPELSATPIYEESVQLEPSVSPLVPSSLSLHAALAMPDLKQPNSPEIDVVVVPAIDLALMESSEGESSRSTDTPASKVTSSTKQPLRKSRKGIGSNPTKTSIMTYPVEMADMEAETSLCGEIHDLWSSHVEKGKSLRGGRLELNELRAKLGQRLSKYKKLLVGTGRGGKWTNFLDIIGIPKSTADRYVETFDQVQLPVGVKLLTEELYVPSTEDIAALVKKLKPQIARVLTTPDAIALFLGALAVALQPSPTAN